VAGYCPAAHSAASSRRRKGVSKGCAAAWGVAVAAAAAAAAVGVTPQSDSSSDETRPGMPSARAAQMARQSAAVERARERSGEGVVQRQAKGMLSGSLTSWQSVAQR
jgi:hypothetical protein